MHYKILFVICIIKLKSGNHFHDIFNFLACSVTQHAAYTGLSMKNSHVDQWKKHHFLKWEASMSVEPLRLAMLRNMDWLVDIF